MTEKEIKQIDSVWNINTYWHCYVISKQDIVISMWEEVSFKWKWKTWVRVLTPDYVSCFAIIWWVMQKVYSKVEIVWWEIESTITLLFIPNYKINQSNSNKNRKTYTIKNDIYMKLIQDDDVFANTKKYFKL